MRMELSRVKRGIIQVKAHRTVEGLWMDKLPLPGKVPFSTHKVLPKKKETSTEPVKRDEVGRPIAKLSGIGVDSDATADDGSKTDATTKGNKENSEKNTIRKSREAMEASERAKEEKRQRAMETVVMAPVFSGTLHPIRPGVLGGQFDKEVLEPGQRYEIRIPNTMMTKAAKKAFNEEAVACQIVSIPLGRAECPVHVKWEWPPNTWYSHKPLPLEVHYALWNRTTNKEVDRGVLRNRGRGAALLKTR